MTLKISETGHDNFDLEKWPKSLLYPDQKRYLAILAYIIGFCFDNDAQRYIFGTTFWICSLYLNWDLYIATSRTEANLTYIHGRYEPSYLSIKELHGI